MPSIRQITVNWASPGGGGTSVLNFATAPDVAVQRTALQAFLQAWMVHTSAVVTYNISTSGREIDDATGGLTGAWSEGTAKTGIGGGGAQPVADATQVLVRWQTQTITPGGRFLVGRTFLPGLASTKLSQGNVQSAVVTDMADAAEALITPEVQLVVWHRPSALAPASGMAVQVDGVSVWQELAVLRSRRG